MPGGSKVNVSAVNDIVVSITTKGEGIDHRYGPIPENDHANGFNNEHGLMIVDLKRTRVEEETQIKSVVPNRGHEQGIVDLAETNLIQIVVSRLQAHLAL